MAGEPELVAALNAGRGELAERLGIVLTGADQDRVTGTMPVQGNRSRSDYCTAAPAPPSPRRWVRFMRFWSPGPERRPSASN